jgi:hypothetical protein
MNKLHKTYNEEGTLDGLYCIENYENNKEKPWLVYWQEHGVRYDIERFSNEEDAEECVIKRRSNNK